MPLASAVLFDYGLVLSAAPDAAAWERLKSRLHADEDAFHAAYWRPRHDYDRGALNGSTYWRTVAGELNESLTDDGLAALIDDDTILWTQPNQPMIDWAATLQQARIPTGILSNIGDAMEHGVRSRCPWLQEFNHHTFSHSLGLAKPDTAIYLHAATGLKTPSDEILFIDDREENIAAAQSIGMQTIHYTSHGAFEAALRANHPHLASPDRKSPQTTSPRSNSEHERHSSTPVST